MKNILAQLKPENYYHLFNRSNNYEPMFIEEKNRTFFLLKLKYYLSEYVDFHAYTLLPNHFHLSIRVKAISEIAKALSSVSKSQKTIAMQHFENSSLSSLEDSCHQLISSQFSRTFNSYTKSINKKYQRTGNMFNRPFKRAHLRTLNDLQYNIYYLHHNARKHGIVRNFLKHSWMSYFEIINGSSELVHSDKTIEIFGGKEEFIQFHQPDRF